MQGLKRGDPIADEFAFVSGFNYAENNPVMHIDLWGLQLMISPILMGGEYRCNT